MNGSLDCFCMIGLFVRYSFRAFQPDDHFTPRCNNKLDITKLIDFLTSIFLRDTNKKKKKSFEPKICMRKRNRMMFVVVSLMSEILKLCVMFNVAMETQRKEKKKETNGGNDTLHEILFLLQFFLTCHLRQECPVREKTVSFHHQNKTL